jgi:hypothetical protein
MLGAEPGGEYAPLERARRTMVNKLAERRPLFHRRGSNGLRTSFQWRVRPSIASATEAGWTAGHGSERRWLARSSLTDSYSS